MSISSSEPASSYTSVEEFNARPGDRAHSTIVGGVVS